MESQRKLDDENRILHRRRGIYRIGKNNKERATTPEPSNLMPCEEAPLVAPTITTAVAPPTVAAVLIASTVLTVVNTVLTAVLTIVSSVLTVVNTVLTIVNTILAIVSTVLTAVGITTNGKLDARTHVKKKVA